jgi:hypothetical protein
MDTGGLTTPPEAGSYQTLSMPGVPSPCRLNHTSSAAPSTCSPVVIGAADGGKLGVDNPVGVVPGDAGPSSTTGRPAVCPAAGPQPPRPATPARPAALATPASPASVMSLLL